MATRSAYNYTHYQAISMAISMLFSWPVWNVSCESLFSNDAKANNINRIDFEKLLRAVIQNNFFNFEGKIYKQIDGATMGSPLGPALA